ncbi:hypothetical protein Tco_0911674, partial [Tanacetum coccineum]
KKAQQNQNPEAWQTSMVRDGSVFRYDPDYLREQFAEPIPGQTIVAMADRTMEELLRAPTEGYGEAIVLPEINADHFEIKTNLLQLHEDFHVSNLKKCYADEPLVMPLEGIHVDDVEEPVEIMEREIKRLKRSRIPLVKVRWNSRRGPEFTWEREDSFKQKYPQLFTNRASSSTTRS